MLMMPFKRTLLFLIPALLVFACDDILEVTDISEENVVLLAPSDGTTVLQTKVSFSWNEVFEATQYQVQVATPGFENAAQIVVDTLIVLDTTYAGARFDKILIDSDYEWRVKAQNSDYETNFTTNIFKVNSLGN